MDSLRSSFKSFLALSIFLYKVSAWYRFVIYKAARIVKNIKKGICFVTGSETNTLPSITPLIWTRGRFFALLPLFIAAR
jgi:hypothetical protein